MIYYFIAKYYLLDLIGKNVLFSGGTSNNYFFLSNIYVKIKDELICLNYFLFTSHQLVRIKLQGKSNKRNIMKCVIIKYVNHRL